eukprot:CAMPEP_0201522038 /NCGR_PEP_ID=MMETSP0161_2-20130828/16416_1 /ASSEMBLY_ACC=CAM_ASM_000251 /TAXON_ID=180227 /ORGANISM="Neoparamoeba aestuarina, Strain SoJaBio B1-5/56/2" /LENGTH=228 /DNA_ID=CAMNT_0047920789 /DNA_START=65 /DNA_END=749 /DNA_ORIENTATION=+
MSTKDGNTIIVGLTGGIATGKSTTCQLFASQAKAKNLEVVLLNADQFGHQAYKKGTEGFDKLVDYFGQDIVGEDGEINRRKLGPIVFSDPKKLQALNSMVWPIIRTLIDKQIKEEIKNFGSEGKHLILVEAAVMVEAKWMDLFDEVWVVVTDPDVAIERLMARNKLSKEEAQKRINSQITNEEREKVANVVVRNDGTESVLEGQIAEKLSELMADTLFLLLCEQQQNK